MKLNSFMKHKLWRKLSRGESGGGQQKSLFRLKRRRGVRGTRSYRSRPDRGGVSTSVLPRKREPVAVASQGPIPQPLWIRYSPSCLLDCRGRSREEQESFKKNQVFGERETACVAFRSESGEGGARRPITDPSSRRDVKHVNQSESDQDQTSELQQ